MALTVEEERERRENLWRELLAQGGPAEVGPSVLRDLGIYGGAQGIWVDKERTQHIGAEASGITVAILHTGTSYPDDFGEDGLLYHYPKTSRPPARDDGEVEATKAAGRLRVPVFVVRYADRGTTRTVYRGWVEDWDDDARLSLISFADSPAPPVPQPSRDDPFDLVDGRRNRTTREVTTRPGQQRFKFRVLQRCSARCCVCDVAIVEFLDAAHICPKEQQGTDDPRNGIVLCALHHRAFDRGFFAIEPHTLALLYRPGGPTKDALRISVDDLAHLPQAPHPDALAWFLERWSPSKAATTERAGAASAVRTG